MSERRCPAINVWKCEVCNALTVAIDIDEGVTPFMLGCRANDKCKGMGQSSFYPEPPIPAHIASALAWEWYAPSPEERATFDSAMREHCERGGLAIRELTDAGRNALASIMGGQA